MNAENGPNMDVMEEMESLRQRVTELEHTEAERLRVKQEEAETRRKRDSQTIVFLAASPILLEIFLFVLNRSYMSNLFQSSNLSYGLGIQGAIFLLALISFFTLRSSQSVVWSGKVMLGWVMGILAFLFFIIPAWMLVFLAPAALILLRTSSAG